MFTSKTKLKMCIWQQRSAPFYRRLKRRGGGTNNKQRNIYSWRKLQTLLLAEKRRLQSLESILVHMRKNNYPILQVFFCAEHIYIIEIIRNLNCYLSQSRIMWTSIIPLKLNSSCWQDDRKANQKCHFVSCKFSVSWGGSRKMRVATS